MTTVVSPYVTGTSITSILLVIKVSYREVKGLSDGHTASSDVTIWILTDLSLILFAKHSIIGW